MIFTEQESEVILTHKNNLVNLCEKNEETSRLEVKKVDKHYIGKPDLTFEERVLIGSAARAGLGTSSSLAEEFNLDRNQVANLKAGRTTTIANPRYKRNIELEERVLGKTSEIQDKAFDLLARSLGVISDDKLAKLDAKDASSVAVNFSRIIQNTTTQNNQHDNRIQVIMYAPPQKELTAYKTVES